MKRKVYLGSTRDKLTFISCFVGSGMVYITATNGDFWWSLFFVFVLIVLLFLVVVISDQESDDGEVSEFNDVIEKVSDIESQLSDLSNFLKRQRNNLSETEDIISALKVEKEALDPVVSARKETVDAILAAHAKRSSSSFLKERIVAFGLGVLASIVASTIFEVVYLS